MHCLMRNENGSSIDSWFYSFIHSFDSSIHAVSSYHGQARAMCKWYLPDSGGYSLFSLEMMLRCLDCLRLKAPDLSVWSTAVAILDAKVRRFLVLVLGVLVKVLEFGRAAATKLEVFGRYVKLWSSGRKKAFDAYFIRLCIMNLQNPFDVLFWECSGRHHEKAKVVHVYIVGTRTKAGEKGVSIKWNCHRCWRFVRSTVQ